MAGDVAIVDLRGVVYSEYFATTKEARHKPDSLVEKEYRMLVNLLGVIRAPVSAHHAYEADDVVFTAVQEAAGKACTVLVMTNDKDLCSWPTSAGSRRLKQESDERG